MINAPFTAFLDRDGVFNTHGNNLRSWDQIELLPGVVEAFARLNRPDVQTCLCTNQPWAAMGLARRSQIRAVNERLQRELAAGGGSLDRVEVAWAPGWLPHRRRKPRPGMLVDAAHAMRNVDPRRSVMIGDKVKDAQAGAAFGARTILVCTTSPEAKLRAGAQRAGLAVDAYVDGLPAAVDWILAHIDDTVE